jgi:hypothetical protein
MKKLIPLLILVGGAVSGFSQGQISFQNSVAFATVDPTGGAREIYTSTPFVAGAAGNGLSGTQFVAELYMGADAGSLAPMTSTISRFRAATSINRGKWAATGVNGPNDFVTTAFAPGTIVTCQVKVWDLSLFPAYEGAGGITGQSSTFTYKVPPIGDTTVADFYMEGLQAFALVPEPSAIALGVMGIAGLLFIRRRK